MRLYIVYNNQTYNLPNVYLKDGFYPTYDGCTEENDLPPMEPAMWCKILALHNIVINCDVQSLTWETKSDKHKNSMNSHVYKSNENCFGHEDDQELYALSKFIIEKSFEDCQQLFLRLMHCFVIPRIWFDIDDIIILEQVMGSQVQSVKALTKKLETTCFDVTDYQYKLELMQEEFLPSIDKMIDNGQCTKGFLEILLCDLDKCEERVRKRLEKAQSHYDKIASPQNPSTSESSYEMIGMNQERDFIHKKLALIVAAREEIRARKDDLSTENQENDLVITYTEKRAILEALREERRKLTRQKYCVSMVKEVLDAILNDVKLHGFAEPDNADVQGIRPSDVLQNSLKPEWQTLSQRVASIIHNSKNPIGNLFRNFCAEVNNTCQKSDKDKREGEEYIFHCGHSTFYVSLTEVMNTHGDLEQLKEKLSLHMQEATNLLKNYVKNNETTSFQIDMIRIAYELCFYTNTHENIVKLYKQVYFQNINDIETDIKMIKEHFVRNMMKLPVSDVLREIFEKKSIHKINYSEASNSIDEKDQRTKSYLIMTIKESCRVRETLKGNRLGSLGSLIDEWDTKAEPINESLQRSFSTEERNIKKKSEEEEEDCFEESFETVIQHIQAVFKSPSPIQKLKHLNLSLQKIIFKVSRSFSQENNESCLSYEECLPALGLVLLQLSPFEVAMLWTHFTILEDIAAPFLKEGTYRQAFTCYQKILKIIAEDLWLDLSQGCIRCTVNGISVEQ